MMITRKWRNKIGVFIAFVAPLPASLGACGARSSDQRTELQAAASRPARIISVSPSVTEILYGVGAWSQVVAVSRYCTYPEDVANRPRVEGWGNTNLEQVMALKPDLIIGVDMQAAFLRDRLEGLGLRALFVKSDSLGDVFTCIGEIGRAVGHEHEASELVSRTQTQIAEVQRVVSGRERPRILCIVDRVPGTLREMSTAAPGTFIDDLIGIAGGDSIAPPSEHGWGSITKEAIIDLNPDVIIDLSHSSKGSLGEDPTAVWRDLREVNAVRTGRVYYMPDHVTVHPSQLVGDTAAALARLIHPEAFPDGQR